MIDTDLGFSEAELQTLLQNIDRLSESELAAIMAQVEELERRKSQKAAQDDLIEFCKRMQPDYKVGRHHRRLADLLEAIEQGKKDRICVSVPPRHGKSQLVSIYYAAWYLGRNPTHKVMLVSHTTDLAVDFGRKVRNLIASPDFASVFPDVGLAADSKSAGRWNTTHGGEFFACGVGSALAGRGAHLLLIDDPHSEQDILNGNFGVFEKAYEWFTYGARTRLMPGGRVAIVHCMVGDTQVMLPSGSTKALRDIQPGDTVLSYKGGSLVPRRVLNWANQGPDHVYTITMNNGNLIKANARHPFLVRRDGVDTWTKLRDLRVGDSLVALKDVPGLPDLTALLENAEPAYPETVTTEGTQTLCSGVRDTGVSIAEKPVQNTGVVNPRTLADYAVSTITGLTTSCVKLLGLPMTRKSESGTIYARGTGSLPKTTWRCVINSAIAALYAAVMPQPLINPQLGVTTTRLQSTTATKQVSCGPYCATHATSSSAQKTPQKPLSAQLCTYEITNIAPDGVEEVFDIQVEDTENFIANGVVSHNTRWAQQDLIGRVVQDMVQNEGSDQYEVFEFPAIIEKTEADGSVTETALWPEFFDLAALKRTKASMPVFQWNAQYQQNPTGEEASIIKREWWRLWPGDTLPHVEYVIMALDAAAEATNRADFTSLTTWGVFYNEEEGAHQIILLNAIKRRIEFPELKLLASEEYKDWNPDAFIVEKKSSGTALYQEMRRAGLLVQEYTPVRGTANNPNTKMARLNSVSDIISAGLVWVPAKRWAEDLVEEVAGFPVAAHDDQVDTTIMALMRFRQGGFIRLPSDERYDEDDEVPKRAAYY